MKLGHWSCHFDEPFDFAQEKLCEEKSCTMPHKDFSWRWWLSSEAYRNQAPREMTNPRSFQTLPLILYHRLLLSPAFCDKTDRGSQKAIFFTDLIFQITDVSPVHQFRVIDIDHERGRVTADLCTVEHLQLPSRM